MAGVPAPRRRAAKEPREARVGPAGGGPARSSGARIRIHPPRAEACARRALRHRAASRDRDDGRAAHFARRAPARLRCDRPGGQGADLGPAVELADGAAAAGNRGRRAPVLVAGQPVRRIHGRRCDEEGGRRGRTADQGLRCARRVGRNVEPRGRDPFRRHGNGPDLPGTRGRRNESRGGRPGSGAQGDERRLAAVSTRRQALHLPRHRREARRQRVLDCVDRLEREDEAGARPDARGIRASRFPPLRAGPDARRAALRRERRARSRASRSPWPKRSAPTTWAWRASRSRTTACSPIAPARPAGASSGGIAPGASSTRWAIRAIMRIPRSRRRETASRSTSPTRAPPRSTSGSGISRAASIRGSPSARATTIALCGRRTARRSSSGPTAGGVSTCTRSPRAARAKRSSCSRPTSPSRQRAGRRTGSTSLTPRRNAEDVDDLWALPTFGDKKPIPIAVSPFNEQNPMFSPDGRYVAFVSNESGREEIYVQTFPEPGGKWQVSNGGGSDPSWRGDGRSSTTARRTRSSWRSRFAPVPTSRPACPGDLFPFRSGPAPAQQVHARRPMANVSWSRRRSAARQCARRRSS